MMLPPPGTTPISIADLTELSASSYLGWAGVGEGGRQKGGRGESDK
jgi:hypothetical protein